MSPARRFPSRWAPRWVCAVLLGLLSAGGAGAGCTAVTGFPNFQPGDAGECELMPYYRDLDGDGWGVIGNTVQLCGAPDGGFSLLAGDCDDNEAAINPDSREMCDGIDNDCDDRSQDGEDEDTLGADCDSPGDEDLCEEGVWECTGGSLVCSDPGDETPEQCGGGDDDCDGVIDEGFLVGYPDDDMDDFGDPARPMLFCDGVLGAGYVEDDTDCDDDCMGCHPGIVGETCDGRDNDCDDGVDEGLIATYYADTDGDTFGDPGVSMMACERPAGYVSNSDDCNDSCTRCRPGGMETLCDGLDGDCNGLIDDGPSDGGTVEDGFCRVCTHLAYGGHTYMICPEGTDGRAANRSVAQTRCGPAYSLVYINDSAEQEALWMAAMSVRGDITGAPIGFWIGLWDQPSPGTMGWDLDPGFDPLGAGGFQAWEGAEPDNLSGIDDSAGVAGADCVQMNVAAGGNWGDDRCSTELGWICENIIP